MRRPPYRIDEISTHVVGARLTRVPLRDWAHDLDAMARIAADIAYLVNPHNPRPAPNSPGYSSTPATRSSPRRPTSSSRRPQTSTRWSAGSPSTPSPCAPAPRSASPARSGSACLPARPAPPAQRAQNHPRPADGRVMLTHGDRITTIRRMVLLGAGAFGGRQRGDGFQLRLVLERGNPPSPRQPQITHHASASQPQRPRQRPVTRLRVLADSEPSPS
jgi:hypothetical protein